MAERLVAAGHDVSFVGTPDGLESRLATEAGLTYHGIRARGFDRGRPWTLLTAAFTAVASVVRAGLLLRRLRVDVVVGFGGYVALPLGVAAGVLRVPLMLHEQNAVPGLANRVLSRWASAVGLTYPSARELLAHAERCEVTGNPVRVAVLEASRERGRAMLGVPSGDPLVLVFGGSRGSQHINETFVRIAPALMSVPALRVAHVAGRIEAAAVRERVSSAVPGAGDRYVVHDYIDAMGDAISASDIIVSRAGATSIAEITAIGRPAVLVPYPFATDDHQTRNARDLAESGAAIVVPDSELDGDAIERAVTRLLGDPSERERMARATAAFARRDAADRLVRLIESVGVAGEETR